MSKFSTSIKQIMALAFGLCLAMASLPALAATAATSLAPALPQAILASVWESVTYETQAAGYALPETQKQSLQNTALARWHEGKIQSLQDLQAFFKAHLPSSTTSAIDRAFSYLELNTEPFEKTLSLPNILSQKTNSSYVESIGFSTEIQPIKTTALQWPHVNDYVKSRLGPLHAILRTLRPQDEILFSNGPLSDLISASQSSAIQSIEALNIPISSYGKKLTLVHLKNGSTILILSDVAGFIFLRHYELLVKAFYQGKASPRIVIEESPELYQKSYQSLTEAAQSRRSQLGAIDTVIVGYTEIFAKRWAADRLLRTVQTETWSFDLYQLSNSHRVVVLSRSAPYHGELLAENIRELLVDFPSIKTVLFAGSGGELTAGLPYEMKYPVAVQGSLGQTLRNVLASGTDLKIHRSVISPLAETPQLLNRFTTEQVETIDMELGHFPENLKNIQFGFGVLVTDFPNQTTVSSAVSLALQDGSKKRQAADAFATTVENYLLRTP